MSVDTKITGFADLQKQLLRLDDKVTKKEVLKVLRVVALPVVKAVQSKVKVAPKDHYVSGKRAYRKYVKGNLKRSIGRIEGKKGLGRENPVLYVGPQSKGRKDDGWYGFMIEYGTKYQKAQPFMRAGVAVVKNGAGERAERRIAKYIQKQIKRLEK